MQAFDDQSEVARDSFLRRQAIAVVAQLPDQREDALKVLSYARILMMTFMTRELALQVAEVTQLELVRS